MDKLKSFIRTKGFKAFCLLLLLGGLVLVIGNFAQNAQNSGVLQ